MTNVQQIDLMYQASRENREWCLGKNPHLSPRELDVNQAGFEAGWRQAVSAMKLHAQLRLK
jgi:hypothetical protein